MYAIRSYYEGARLSQATLERANLRESCFVDAVLGDRPDGEVAAPELGGDRVLPAGPGPGGRRALDFHRIGRLELSPATISLPRLLRSTVANFSGFV